MPLSPDNPNRDRNFVILVLGGVVLFAIVMGGYVTLSLAGQDTDTYLRFLTTVVLVIVPSSLSAWQAFKAKQNSQQAVETAQAIRDDVHNGVLKDKVKEGVAEVLHPENGPVTYSGGTDIAQSTQEGSDSSGR
jgi:flagellar basal body-associated protein FliL